MLSLGEGENRFDRGFLDALGGALDEVERAATPAALVTTGGPRFYSNGYDLDALALLVRDERRRFIRDYERVLARLLLFRCPCVAALSGHAVGAGALFALAHDFRVMQRERGFFWLPEVDARIPFRPGMAALLRRRLEPAALRDLVLAGARVLGREALALGIVEALATPSELLPCAVARAQQLAGTDPATRVALARGLVGDVAALLDPI